MSSVTSPDGYTRIAEQLRSGSVQLLTTDVFDTLVWRPVARPEHLWHSFGEQLRARGLLAPWVEPAAFAVGRIRAEARARELNRTPDRAPECHLTEIWAQLPTAWLTTDDRSAYVTAELEAEIAALRVHRPALDTIAAAVELGVPVVAVSDTYLTSAQLTDVLRRVGVPVERLAGVVTSSDEGLGKADGLLGVVWRRHGVGAKRVLHMGDHPIADGQAATRAGGEAVVLSVPPDDDCTAAAATAALRWSAGHGSDAGRSAVVRETLVAAGPDGLDPAFQFGAAVAGPLMAGFAHWVSDTTRALGAGTVHCLLREGDMIAHAIEVTNPEGVRPVRLHASRWGVLRAAVIDGTVDELGEALARRADLTAEQVTHAFGVDLDDVRRVIGRAPLDHRRRAEAIAAIAADASLHEQILASSAELRVRLVRYLEQRLVLDDGPVVLCDIGWGGMIQAGLTRVFRSMSITQDVVGLYTMVGPGAAERLATGARMMSYVPVDDPRAVDIVAAIARNPELLERVNTPALGTLLDFTEAGEPICQDVADDHRPPSLEAAQRGLRAVVRRSATMLDAPLRHQWAHDATMRVALADAVAATLVAPHPRLAEAVGHWQHDDVAGTGRVTLTEGGLVDLLAYANPVDLADIPMSDTFWIPGLASTGNAGLAAQLEAIGLGVDAEQLCPESPLGACLLAVFPTAGVRSELLWQTTPRINAEGWSLVRMGGTVSSMRVLRIDPSERAAVVEIGLLRVRIHHDGGIHELVVDSLGGKVRIDGGRVLGDRVALLRAGAQLLVSPPPGLSGVHRVDVDLAYRGYVVTGMSRFLVPPRWRSVPRRVARQGRDTLRRWQRSLRTRR